MAWSERITDYNKNNIMENKALGQSDDRDIALLLLDRLAFVKYLKLATVCNEDMTAPSKVKPKHL